MKVLMFGWEFPPHNSGGLGVACQGLTYALLRKGIEIIFVLPRKIPVGNNTINFAFADKIGGLTIKEIKSKITSPYRTSTSSSKIFEYGGIDPSYDYYYDLLNEVLLYARNARRVALQSEYDVIHAHDWLSFKAGIAAKEVSGKPLIAHIHATEYDRSGDNPNPLIKAIELEGFLKADKIIAVSNFTKQVVTERYGIDPAKIEVAHNGVDLSEIDYDEVAKADILRASKDAGYSIVLFLGRLTYQKNPEMMLKAAKEILKYNPKTLFVYGGSGDMEQHLMHMAASMGISDKVIFAGFVRGNDKNKLFRIADVFIMPSISEPFGIVPLESLANHTPVIISKQSGISEVLRNSLQVDFWDVDEIVNKIVSVLKYNSLKTDLSLNGFNELPNISWDKTASEVTDVYSHLIT
ncbi:glycosyltransferase family 4 protein [Candidatus Dojkabacteria bacterium]|uniref:Glycosyltransferase family 4 protein n=1 Tax=Candidatus Dojkabacteria bacterium TaxID=2099670 RepID=A0A955LAA4_9BACT|nr:glycosyltransferase family 4 protein [Candidatus Dojkabacteria bacterium]